jgi:hypothetical protein
MSRVWLSPKCAGRSFRGTRRRDTTSACLLGRRDCHGVSDQIGVGAVRKRPTKSSASFFAFARRVDEVSPIAPRTASALPSHRDYWHTQAKRRLVPQVMRSHAGEKLRPERVQQRARLSRPAEKTPTGQGIWTCRLEALSRQDQRRRRRYVLEARSCSKLATARGLLRLHG